MKRIALPLALGLTLGCGSTDPTVDPAALNGTYRATTFTLELQGSGRRDVLAAGGSVTFTLNPGQVTEGRLFIPVTAGVTATTVDEQLVGRYTILGKTIIRWESEPAGAYIDGYSFTVDPPELRSYLSIQSPTPGLLSLVLRKQ
jgi:hypothetical protein